MWNEKPVINVEFYFDREHTYTDFILTAKIYYKDGTIKKVNLDAVKRIDDGMGNITYEYEVDEEHPPYGPAGKGLKKSFYQYTLNDGDDEKISKIYVNVEYKGSTATNYAGAYVGAGEGVLVHNGWRM